MGHSDRIGQTEFIAKLFNSPRCFLRCVLYGARRARWGTLKGLGKIAFMGKQLNPLGVSYALHLMRQGELHGAR